MQIAIKKLEHVETHVPPDVDVDDTANNQNKSPNDIDESTHPDPSTSTSANEAQNESVASHEEFIEDDDQTTSSHLNFQVPTTQH